MRRQQLCGAVLAVVIGGTLVGCTDEIDDLLDSVDDAATQEQPGGTDSSQGAEQGSISDSVLPGLPSPEEARTQLASLTVAEPGSMAGYGRERFSHWSTVDGCSARQIVLQRDGTNVVVDDSCQPESGEWYSPFDDVTLTDASDVDIDHIVPLAEAWRSGADAWDDERRKEFANDLTNPQLIAVSASSNRSKGDQHPGDWQPIEAYWCEYGLAWTGTKHAYDLTVTEDEHEQLVEMLDTCPAP
ncbi:HNH endonuclease family protein [Streptomyces sp. ACA25]|uniref:HNH endonuclease family protein n=1 Tax=Streptomyces sp. ACA25 TaxID=3022596 RepID=UPI002306FB40|nr:HNH endonuclease family protein [Streptomyces sp. ACA25]MDB1087118.1 HNH endonuclease family protein [Streptomyces sp. ACA25]